jgi:Putative transposase
VVYAKPPFGGPEQVLAYLGRYTHRVAIANSRLLSHFRAHGKTKVMTLDADEFIRRFLLHALPDGFHRIRHYGFLANGSHGDSLALCRRLLGDRVTSAVREPADNHTPGDRPLTAADFAIVLIAVAPCGGSQSCHASATHSHSPVTRHDVPTDVHCDRARSQSCKQRCPHRHRTAD